MAVQCHKIQCASASVLELLSQSAPNGLHSKTPIHAEYLRQLTVTPESLIIPDDCQRYITVCVQSEGQIGPRPWHHKVMSDLSLYATSSEL